MKNKNIQKILFSIMFWVISLTWGILLTSIGGLGTLILNGANLVAKLFGKDLKIRTHVNGCTLITEVGGNWGGLEMGAFAFCGRYTEISPSWYEHTRRHEFGHSLQHLIFGPLFLFIVAIPSACRYWYQRIMQSKGKQFPSDWYDSIWFEGGATRWGTKVIDWFEN